MFLLSGLLLSAGSWIWSVNLSIYHALNSLAGQSYIFDKVVGLGLSTNLVKAGVIGACFLFAWMAGTDAAQIASRRKVLLITLIASVFVLATTKSLSKSVFLPRPFILSERSFHLENEQLVETPKLEYSVPYDDDSEKLYRELKNGKIFQNDLGAFPSDHAGFFLTIALGIFLAYRRPGVIALLWTIFIPLGAKIILGQHFPIDIATGAVIAIVVLLTMQFILGRWGNRVLDPVVDWTMRNSALTAAVLFIVLFEVSSTLDGVRDVGKVGKDVAKHMLGRPQS